MHHAVCAESLPSIVQFRLLMVSYYPLTENSRPTCAELHSRALEVPSCMCCADHHHGLVAYGTVPPLPPLAGGNVPYIARPACLGESEAPAVLLLALQACAHLYQKHTYGWHGLDTSSDTGTAQCNANTGHGSRVWPGSPDPDHQAHRLGSPMAHATPGACSGSVCSEPMHGDHHMGPLSQLAASACCSICRAGWYHRLPQRWMQQLIYILAPDQCRGDTVVERQQGCTCALM